MKNWRERRKVISSRKITGKNNNETISKVINSWWSSAGCRWLFWEWGARCVAPFGFDMVVIPDLPPGFGVSLYWISYKYLLLLPSFCFISVGNSAGKPSGVRYAIIWNCVLQCYLWLYHSHWWQYLWIITEFYCTGKYFVLCKLDGYVG